MLWSYPLQDQTARPTTAYTSRFWSAWPIPPSGAPDRPRAATETNHCSENGSLRGGVLVFRMETDVPPWRRFYTVNPAAGPRTFPTPRPCLREPSRVLPDTPTRPRFGTSLPHHASEPRPTTCPLIPRTLPLGPDLSRAPFPASQAQRSPSPSGHPCPRAPAAPCRGPWALRWGRSARSCGRRFLALSGRCEWSNSGLGERKRLRRGRTAPSAALILAAAALALREAAPPAQMAKGSKGTHGDPCWVVEEREDGANVNNWHWCGRSGAPAAARGSRPSGAARTVRPLRILAPCALGAGRAWPHLVAPPGPRALPLRAGLAQVQRIPFPCLSCFKGGSSVASGLRTAFGV